MDKKDLTERDICTRFITPSLRAAGWDWDSQFREEVNLTSGRVVVRGNKAKRDEKSIRRADYVLYFKPGIPIAVVEAKDNNHSIAGDGHRHRQDLHRLPDHLAFVEGGRQEAHPVSGRPQHSGRSDQDQ
jgi:type I site-specific restriction endonuclease